MLLLLHTPPAVALASKAVPPTQTLVTPVIGATIGSALTVTGIVAIPEQPNTSVYV